MTLVPTATKQPKITFELVGADSFRPASPATPWPQPTGSAARSAHARRGCTQALTDEPCASRTSQFTSSSSHPPRHRPGLVRVATGPKATRRVTSHSPPLVCRLVGPRPGRSASPRRLNLVARSESATEAKRTAKMSIDGCIHIYCISSLLLSYIKMSCVCCTLS